MSDPKDDGVAGQLTALLARITELETSSAASQRRRRRLSRGRRVALSVGVIGAVAAATTGVAMASGTSNPGLTYVTVSPAGAVATAVSIAAGKAAAYTVSGGSTTVPTGATAVRLSVSVSGPDAGSIGAYPSGTGGGGSGQKVSWLAGKSATGTLDENVGASNKVTFSNSSAGAAKVTVTVTGYSTQVAANDVNGVGGTAGQVLTNNGAGSVWSTLPAGSAANFSTTGGTNGQVLTNKGSSVVWANPAQGSAAKFTGTGGTAGQVLTNTGTGASWQDVNTTSSPWFYLSNETQQTLDETVLWTETESVPALTASVLANSSVSVYMQFGGNVVPLPYTSSVDGPLFTTVSYQLNVGQILITRSTSDNSGSTELPGSLQFRYVITTATGPAAGAAAAPAASKPNSKASSTK